MMFYLLITKEIHHNYIDVNISTPAAVLGWTETAAGNATDTSVANVD
jgi:hypothetical protein